ncbi:VOC family protein [Paracoccus xiamenensis]|uniref:VOC family protein n=1 Tax=Paracoccus xiamenensis TaxID=2714901 RepID=UPI00140C05D2|nr:VOC family protein [Paracoccus xiamenensis]NHF72155.1 VOC family protein [Paracoccus xiamenensis]
MPLELDHLVVAAETLPEGEAMLTDLFRAPPEPGGKHAIMGTHNRLWRLTAREYVELIAIDPQAEAPPYPRWFGLDDFRGPPRLVAWVCRAKPLKPPPGSTIREAARGDLHWRIAIPDSGQSDSDGLDPLRIDWGTGPHPTDTMPDLGLRLLRLDLHHPKPPKLDMKDPRISISKSDPQLAAHISTPFGKVTL